MRSDRTGVERVAHHDDQPRLGQEAAEAAGDADVLGGLLEQEAPAGGLRLGAGGEEIAAGAGERAARLEEVGLLGDQRDGRMVAEPRGDQRGAGVAAAEHEGEAGAVGDRRHAGVEAGVERDPQPVGDALEAAAGLGVAERDRRVEAVLGHGAMLRRGRRRRQSAAARGLPAVGWVLVWREEKRRRVRSW